MTGLKWLEGRLQQEHHATLVLELTAERPGEQDVRERLTRAGMTIAASGIAIDEATGTRRLNFDLRLFGRAGEAAIAKLVWQTKR